MITLSTNNGYSITADNITTWIPAKNGLPDFSGLSEPYRTSAEDDYRVWIADGNVLPVPEPVIPPITPNWQGFLDAMDVPELGGNGLFQIGFGSSNPSVQIVFATLYTVLLRLNDKQSQADNSVPEWRTFQFLYLAAIGVYTDEQAVLVNAALDKNDIPIVKP